MMTFLPIILTFKMMKATGSLKELKAEGREGVKWELGLSFFRGWEMRFCALGLGFMKQKQ